LQPYLDYRVLRRARVVTAEVVIDYVDRTTSNLAYLVSYSAGVAGRIS
jgi:hypothetical protein